MSEELRIGAPERAEKGQGTRHLDCDQYEACLGYAAKKDWTGFHCEDCTYEADQASARAAGATEKAKALCSDCQEKETLGNSPFCPSCLGVRGNRAKAAKVKNKGTEAAKAIEKLTKAKETQRSRPKDKKTLRHAHTALLLEFGKHASILREVESLADKEIRPIECQVIYMLKKQLTREEEVQVS